MVEEFGIYLNYVRKLGFEENPDYDFLRDLLTKVLRNSGEVRLYSSSVLPLFVFSDGVCTLTDRGRSIRLDVTEWRERVGSQRCESCLSRFEDDWCADPASCNLISRPQLSRLVNAMRIVVLATGLTVPTTGHLRLNPPPRTPLRLSQRSSGALLSASPPSTSPCRHPTTPRGPQPPRPPSRKWPSLHLHDGRAMCRRPLSSNLSSSRTRSRLQDSIPMQTRRVRWTRRIGRR